MNAIEIRKNDDQVIRIVVKELYMIKKKIIIVL